VFRRGVSTIIGVGGPIIPFGETNGLKGSRPRRWGALLGLAFTCPDAATIRTAVEHDVLNASSSTIRTNPDKDLTRERPVAPAGSVVADCFCSFR
jgi:hypothetical protein